MNVLSITMIWIMTSESESADMTSESESADECFEYNNDMDYDK